MLGKQKIPLGRVLGIPIGLDYSWFLIFVLVTWMLAVSYFPVEFTKWPAVQYWAVAAITSILFFVSVVLHELGHSVVAMHYKIPVRSITLFIFGGVAQIATEPPSAAAEFWIAIAGPLVSFALAGIFAGLEGISAGIPPLLALAKYLAFINGMLAVFNLIPGFPLDGGRVFRAIVWSVTKNLRRATVMAGNMGRIIGYLFIFVGVWLALSGNLVNGLWIAFIGWFLENAALSQVRQQEVQSLLAGHKATEAMGHNFTTIPSDVTLQNLVNEHVLAAGRRSFIVEENGQMAGLLTLHHIKEIPQEKWAITTAAQVMTPVTEVKRIQPDAELWSAMEEMTEDGVNQLPVMSNGHILGILSREDLITYLHTLKEMEN
jgi:Zn-dependent protease